MLDDKVFNEIIEKTDIVQLVSEYVPLTKKGQNFFGLCPFHEEKTPSFSVSPTKKIAKCLGCKAGGNPITFLSQIEGVSFYEAAKMLADRVGVNFEYRATNTISEESKQLYKINALSLDFYKHYLFSSQSGQIALDYLHKRGLSDETIKLFDIGLAPKGGNALYQVLRDNGFLDIEIEDACIVKKTKNGYLDLFSERIIFPIIDERKNVLGFSGRIYLPSDEPKYINTAETKVFVKGNTLYNIQNALVAIRKTKTVILCEGQMDAIAVSNAGLTNTVCSLGTALTKQQIQLLKKHATKIVICYDGDKAGIAAAARALEIIGNEIEVKVVILPLKLDPDEYIKKYGKDSFIAYIEKQALDRYDFSYDLLFRGKDIMNPSEFEAVKKEAFKLIRTLGSHTLIERFLDRLAVDLAISKEVLLADFNRKPLPSSLTSKTPKVNKAFGAVKYRNALIHLIALVLSDDLYKEFSTIFYEYETKLIADKLKDDPTNKLYQMSRPSLSYKISQLLLEDDGNYLEVTRIVDNGFADKYTQSQIAELIKRDYPDLYTQIKLAMAEYENVNLARKKTAVSDAFKNLLERQNYVVKKEKRGN